METILTIIFLIALAGLLYSIYKKPSSSPTPTQSLKSYQGIQEIAKLSVLTSDSMLHVANNQSQYLANKQINSRIASFNKADKDYILEAIKEGQSNNGVVSACCDASGNFNPAFAGTLGEIYDKLEILVKLASDNQLQAQTQRLDQYVYARKNFTELQLLYHILSNSNYSYYLTSHKVAELNSINFCLDRLVSIYDDYEPDFNELEQVEYGLTLVSTNDSEVNQRQIQKLDQLLEIA